VSISKPVYCFLSFQVTNFTTQSATVSFTAPVNVTVPIAAYVVDVVPVAGGEKKSGIVYPGTRRRFASFLLMFRDQILYYVSFALLKVGGEPHAIPRLYPLFLSLPDCGFRAAMSNPRAACGPVKVFVRSSLGLRCSRSTNGQVS